MIHVQIISFFPLHHIKETTYATWIVTICKPVPKRVQGGKLPTEGA